MKAKKSIGDLSYYQKIGMACAECNAQITDDISAAAYALTICGNCLTGSRKKRKII